MISDNDLWWYYKYYDIFKRKKEDYKREIESLNSVIKLHGKNIVEIGPGLGGHSQNIIDLNPSKLLLVDKSRFPIEYLKKKFMRSSNNIEVINEDGFLFTYRNSYMCVCFYCLIQQGSSINEILSRLECLLRKENTFKYVSLEIIDVSIHKNKYINQEPRIIYQNAYNRMSVETEIFEGKGIIIKYTGILDRRVVEYNVPIMDFNNKRITNMIKCQGYEIFQEIFLTQSKRRKLLILKRSAL